MREIQVLDKTFELYLTEEQIRSAVRNVAAQMAVELQNERPLLVCILKGALFFFADLLEEVQFPYDLMFYQVSSYEGTQSTQRIQEKMPFPRRLTGRTAVIVEDIVETGGTIAFLTEKFKSLGAKDVRAATLLFKPNRYRGETPVPYIGLNIGDEFIVGYGLDYNQAGRNLPEIYRIVEEK